jgi:hypothetical protein
MPSNLYKNYEFVVLKNVIRFIIKYTLIIYLFIIININTRIYIFDQILFTLTKNAPRAVYFFKRGNKC